MKVLRFLGKMATMIMAFVVYAGLQEAYVVPNKAQVTDLQKVGLALITIVAIGFMIWLYRKSLQNENDWSFDQSPHWGLKRLFIALFGFILLIVGQGLFVHFFASSGTSQNQAALDSLRKTSSSLINILLVVVAPICEELIFRGLFFNTFFTKSTGWNKWFGILVCGFVFAFFHDPHLTKYLFLYWLMGILLSWIYLTTKDLRYSILAHMCNNLLGVL